MIPPKGSGCLEPLSKSGLRNQLVGSTTRRNYKSTGDKKPDLFCAVSGLFLANRHG
jgi:hypothetical protein